MDQSETLPLDALLLWLSLNKEWLFEGIGLSITLFVFGILWQGCKLCGRAALSLASRKKSSAATEQAISPPLTVAEPISTIIRPSPADVDRYGHSLGYHYPNVSGSDYQVYQPKYHPSVRLPVSRRRRRGLGLTGWLILLAVLNLIWVVVS